MQISFKTISVALKFDSEICDSFMRFVVPNLLQSIQKLTLNYVNLCI